MRVQRKNNLIINTSLLINTGGCRQRFYGWVCTHGCGDVCRVSDFRSNARPWISLASSCVYECNKWVTVRHPAGLVRTLNGLRVCDKRETNWLKGQVEIIGCLMSRV